MNRAQWRIRTGGRTLLLLAALILLSASSPAVWFGLRNDFGVPVIVSAANPTQRVGKSFVLNPGEVSMECLIRPGIRKITIADAKNP